MTLKNPPMGWNSWNKLGLNITEKDVLKTADFMCNEGYKDAGYEYIIIDDGWMLPERDADGRLVPDPNKFPNGLKYVADYIHSKGLKFGMYSCAGTRTCGGFPSSFEHEYDDAQSFASWEIDYLKYDFCNFCGVDAKRAYLTMSQALRTTGRDIFFAACNWGWGDKTGDPISQTGYASGEKSPSEWMHACGAHSYRSTSDIYDAWDSTKNIIKLQHNSFHTCGTGFYNDLDMLTVGMYGEGHVCRPSKMTYAEYELQFAYWCFTGAPLIVGADLSLVNDDCKKLLQHRELIRLNQDRECRPPFYIDNKKLTSTYYLGDIYIYGRLLEDGEFAIGVFNLNDGAKTVNLPYMCFGIPYASGKSIDITEIVTGQYVGVRCGDMLAAIPEKSARIYRCKVLN